MSRGTVPAARPTRRPVFDRRFVRVLAARSGACGLLALVALLCAGSNAPASDLATPEAGAVVARLGLEAPPLASFIVHGTLPVPRGVFPRPDGLSPFQLRDRLGTLSPAQVEIVSRYPTRIGSGHADVVELIARVARPSDTSTGDPLAYDVVYLPHEVQEFEPSAEVASFVADPRNLRLRTRDVFDNPYQVQPLGNLSNEWRSRVLKTGDETRQTATHQSLMPAPASSGPAGTLPHMMGVHTYLTQWKGEGFMSLDLRVHNQHCGRWDPDPTDDALDKFYFRSLELRLPRGWALISAYPDPFFGAPYDEGEYRVWPIVAPLADGKMHVMPRMAQFHRRFAIARQGHEARARAVLREETLAFSRPGTTSAGQDLYSWWNSRTARYFPQNHALPDLTHLNDSALRQRLEDDSHLREETLLGHVEPTWPIVSGRLGWAHPWGTSDGGMPGGTEIYLYDGVETAWVGSQAGYRLAQVTHRMYTERQRNVLYDRSGMPSPYEDWLVQIGNVTYFPIWWYNGPLLWAEDPFGITTAPDFQRQAVASLGLVPDYEAELENNHSIDVAHLVRYTRSPKILLWLGNDALARDDMRAQAEAVLFTLARHAQDSYAGNTIVTGLLYLQRYVASFPGQGVHFGRDHGWMLDAMATAYATLEPSWRERTYDFFLDIADVVEKGQADCSGIIQHTPMGNIFDGQYRNRQSIECAIGDNALWSMMTTVFGDAHPVHRERCVEILKKSSYSMISPLVWSTEFDGPWAMIAVGPRNIGQPPFCSYWPPDGNYGFEDNYQAWSSFAYGYELTGDPIFLTRAQQQIGLPLAQGLLAAGIDNIQNRAALLALVQVLE